MPRSQVLRLCAILACGTALVACGSESAGESGSASVSTSSEGEGESGEASASASASEVETGESDESTDTDTDTDTDTVGSSSSSDGNDSGYPPGCTDGGSSTNARVISADEVRLSNLFSGCEDPTGPDDNCSWDHYVAVVNIAGLAPGTYDLADPNSGATYTYTRFWDHQQDESGCVCITDPSATNLPVLSGTITISETQAMGWAMAMTLSQLDGGTGEESFLVELAC